MIKPTMSMHVSRADLDSDLANKYFPKLLKEKEQEIFYLKQDIQRLKFALDNGDNQLIDALTN